MFGILVGKVQSSNRLPCKTKSAPSKVVGRSYFEHFWLRNVIRAKLVCTFRRFNFQKWSDPVSFEHFWLGNVLRATTVCTFSTFQLPKAVRPTQFLPLLTSKCASRYNRVQVCIFHQVTWLRTRPFREPTFPPSRATNLSKTQCLVARLPTFSRTCIFFLLTFSSPFLFSGFLFWLSSLTLPIFVFHLSIFSDFWVLNFLRLYAINNSNRRVLHNHRTTSEWI